MNSGCFNSVILAAALDACPIAFGKFFYSHYRLVPTARPYRSFLIGGDGDPATDSDDTVNGSIVNPLAAVESEMATIDSRRSVSDPV